MEGGGDGGGPQHPRERVGNADGSREKGERRKEGEELEEESSRCRVTHRGSVRLVGEWVEAREGW